MKSKLISVVGMGLFILIFLISLFSGNADKTLKSIELPLDYVQSANAGNDYYQDINLVIPDGISKIISAELVINGDYPSSTVIYARLSNGNGNLYECRPDRWTTPAVSSVSNYKASFDCSNLAKNYDSGRFKVGYRVSKTSSNLRPYLKLTYYNNPLPAIDIFGTEYLPGDIGKVFLQLLDNDNQPIDNSSCYVRIYNPDESVFINITLMDYLDDGLYHYDVTVPNMTGVYMVSAFCDVPKTAKINVTDNFESGTTSGGIGWSESQWQNFTSACKIASTGGPRGVFHLEADGPIGCDTHRSFDSSDCDNLGYITFWAKSAGLEAGDECHYRYYNGTSYRDILNYTNGQDDNLYRYYSIEFCQAFGISTQSEFRLNITRADDATDNCFVDDINIYFVDHYNQSEYQRIMGSGEMHVSSGLLHYLSNRTQNLSLDLGGITEEFTMLGETFIYIPMFIIGLLMLLFITRGSLLIISALLFLGTYLGFNSQGYPFFGYISFAFMILAILKALYERISKTKTSAYFG